MSRDLGVDASIMNIAVAATALFSGIFIVLIGGLADRVGRVRTVRAGFYLSIAGSLLVGLAPAGALASAFLLAGRAFQGLAGATYAGATISNLLLNGAATLIVSLQLVQLAGHLSARRPAC
jgi:MFS transporter, DHA2 family, multidrug resistance protein